jgi:magnesium transporter
MSAALTPLQYVRPPAEPRVWSDSLENFRDLLSSTQESYLTQVSNRLGMATKALEVVATVTLPFVVVSGMWE